MITLRFDQLARMSGGTLLTAERAERRFTGLSIDSRTLVAGSLFVALRGKASDGHLYIDEAIRNGAAGVLAEVAWPGIEGIRAKTAVVAVEDSHQAMMQLAAEYRLTSHARFVGITGSNGKTTTKELTYHLVHAVEPQVYRSPGNFNNLYGMPLAIFAMPETTKVAVMEMGISVPGEMTRLAQMVKPDVICITNIGPSHLEFLKSVEGVARAKLEMVRACGDDVPVIVNADDAVLMKETGRIRRDAITFGVKNSADYQPQSVTIDDTGVSVVEISGQRFRLPMFGHHHVYNLLAAYAVTRTLGYDLAQTNTEAIVLGTAPMRGEKLTIGGVTFIADCYNANPDSVRSALQSFEDEHSSGRRIIILGDMLELGAAEEKHHRDVGTFLNHSVYDRLVLVGPRSRFTYEEVRHSGSPRGSVVHYKDARECAHRIESLLAAGDLVLVKGSRGIGLEKVIEAWKKAHGEN